MKNILKILAVIGAAVLYRFILIDLSFSPTGSFGNATYIFREIVGYALMFQIVPSVIVKVWAKKFKEVI